MAEKEKKLMRAQELGMTEQVYDEVLGKKLKKVRIFNN